jgi:hypothetical protein
MVGIFWAFPGFCRIVIARRLRRSEGRHGDLSLMDKERLLRSETLLDEDVSETRNDSGLT